MRKLRYVERMARRLADVEPIVKTGDVDITPDDIGVTVSSSTRRRRRSVRRGSRSRWTPTWARSS